MKIDIKRIASLANLELSLQESKDLENQLTSIVNYIETLQELDTNNVVETSQVTELRNVTKNDKTIPSLTQNDALSNSKSKEDGFFKVKAILEQ